jgi:hypothetical protein
LDEGAADRAPPVTETAMEKPCREPNLDELLDDDAIRLLMASDKVEESALRALLVTIGTAPPVQAAACCA